MRAKENQTLEIYNLYSTSAPTDQFNELRQKLDEETDPEVISSIFTNYSPSCIVNIFKKFLRELPDPIIPVQWYDRFIEAASK